MARTQVTEYSASWPRKERNWQIKVIWLSSDMQRVTGLRWAATEMNKTNKQTNLFTASKSILVRLRTLQTSFDRRAQAQFHAELKMHHL